MQCSSVFRDTLSRNHRADESKPVSGHPVPKRRDACRLFVALFALCLAQALAATLAGAEPTKLSLADAVKLAQTRSPLTQEAAARVSGADARVRSAKALPTPEIALAQPFGSPDTGGFDEGVLIVQTLEAPGKRRAKINQARSEQAATIADQAGTWQDTTLSVKSAYYEALRADVDVQLAKTTLEITQKFAEAARIQYQAGDVARSNVLRSEIELARVQQELVTAETDRANRYATLRSLTYLPIDAPLELTDPLNFAPVAYQLPNLEALALKNRPDIRSSQLTRDSLESAVRAARLQRRPDFFLEARHQTLNLADGGTSGRAGIILPLFDLGRISADVAAARAALTEQQAKLDETTRLARLDVQTALNALEQARTVVESFQNGRLTRAKELLDMAQTGYARGAFSYIEMIDAQRVYQSEQADYARALASYNIAIATLERAVGGHLG